MGCSGSGMPASTAATRSGVSALSMKSWMWPAGTPPVSGLRRLQPALVRRYATWLAHVPTLISTEADSPRVNGIFGGVQHVVQPVAGVDDEAPARRERVAVGEAGQRGGLGQCADVVAQHDRAEGVQQRRGADHVSGPYAEQPVNLAEAAADDDRCPGCYELAELLVDVVVLELAVDVVEHDHGAVRHRLGEGDHPRHADRGAGDVVRAVQQHDPGPLGHRAAERGHVVAVVAQRHRPPGQSIVASE
jgi:hypothetical protein